MNFLIGMIHNEILVAPFWAWVFAQIIKTLLFVIVNREFNRERLIGDGGMPSSHSATVMALVTATAINHGAGSFQFAFASILALIVMHDAMGVRRETGIQAKVINNMMDFFKDLGKEMPVEDKLKEFVGHSPSQVVVGGLLGILVGFIVCSIM